MLFWCYEKRTTSVQNVVCLHACMYMHAVSTRCCKWSSDEAGSWVWEGVIMGANVGRLIVTNGDFAV